MKGTLAGPFFVCSLTPPKTDGSDQMNLPVLSDSERDSERTSLRVYIYIWSEECLVWSLILTLKNNKLWVELNQLTAYQPSARRVIILVFLCFSL